MAQKTPKMSLPNGSLDVAIDLTGSLEDSETITGTPTVVSQDPTYITASSVITNAAAIEVGRRNTVAIGKAVQWRMVSTAATVYDTAADFPAVGTSGVYYYASQVGLMYEWDTTDTEYDLVTPPDEVELHIWYEATSGTKRRYKVTVPVESPAIEV